MYSVHAGDQTKEKSSIATTERLMVRSVLIVRQNVVLTGARHETLPRESQDLENGSTGPMPVCSDEDLCLMSYLASSQRGNEVMRAGPETGELQSNGLGLRFQPAMMGHV